MLQVRVLYRPPSFPANIPVFIVNSAGFDVSLVKVRLGEKGRNGRLESTRKARKQAERLRRDLENAHTHALGDDAVRRHYFKPGREDFRREFEKAMPRLLMTGAKSRDEQLREIIERMGPLKLRARALAILDGKGLKAWQPFLNGQDGELS
jgi:hypothetical protein